MTKCCDASSLVLLWARLEDGVEAFFEGAVRVPSVLFQLLMILLQSFFLSLYLYATLPSGRACGPVTPGMSSGEEEQEFVEDFEEELLDFCPSPFFVFRCAGVVFHDMSFSDLIPWRS